MPTIKTRLNITLPDEVGEALARLARRDAVPRATKALDLLKVAMELEEDIVLAKLAELRDTPKAKFLSHKQVWG